MGSTLRSGLAVPLLLLTAAFTGQPDKGTYRWILSVDGPKAHLFAAEAEATDFAGPFSFRCLQGEGRIDVSVTINTSEQRAFSRIVADDLYPAVKFRGDPDERFFTLIERITFGELGGWEFHFTLLEDTFPMDALEKTGALFLSVGTVYATDFELKAGLDAVTAFRRHCRKDSVRLRR
ncbi:hypothetical protein HNR00_002201 [Methylorubrum rhodinum]|uniref:Uncharacterized protein n=1 Tax=Methylorubrum rhodinum TaxID=29428 RepID=A0A840ZK47_9HYPH|nr:hypothetical protein [Methylorubrum rhodinum]MBB5757488.1 hypothetical protein [Methylorubrum rhodinum]